MKNLYLILCLLSFALSSKAIDRYVDPNQSVGNGTTLFTSITSALAASDHGDRILIAPGNYVESALNINKSLTLMCQTEGGIIILNANINVVGFPGMKLNLVDINMNNYVVIGDSIANGTYASRAVINIIKCSGLSILLDQNYYELNLISSYFFQNVIMRYGTVVLSRMQQLTINDEPESNLAGRILITNDTIGKFTFNHDNYSLALFNNYLNGLFIWKWNHLLSTTNKILNNDFSSNAYLFIASDNTVPAYNFDFSNNLFLGAVNFNNYCRTGTVCNAYGIVSYDSYMFWNYPYSSFPNSSVPGFFKWTYNGVELMPIYAGSYTLTFYKVIGPINPIDGGNPGHEYYDINLTINDRGRTGGSYSINNYQPSINPSNGKAFIFDLEIPSDLSPGQPVNIKAKGYQKN